MSILLYWSLHPPNNYPQYQKRRCNLIRCHVDLNLVCGQNRIEAIADGAYVQSAITVNRKYEDRAEKCHSNHVQKTRVGTTYRRTPFTAIRA
ncbi:hypothetical protein Golomagni_04264 [Golovinomyces magnicellulatus]|nr:hypothetical protein Golomagni_04264 [Golovinomyces magnicellulatus]